MGSLASLATGLRIAMTVAFAVAGVLQVAVLATVAAQRAPGRAWRLILEAACSLSAIATGLAVGAFQQQVALGSDRPSIPGAPAVLAGMGAVAAGMAAWRLRRSEAGTLAALVGAVALSWDTPVFGVAAVIAAVSHQPTPRTCSSISGRTTRAI
jgi:hypothetical protein